MFYWIFALVLIIVLKFFRINGEFSLKACLVLFIVSTFLFLFSLGGLAEVGMRISLLLGLVGTIQLALGNK